MLVFRCEHKTGGYGPFCDMSLYSLLEYCNNKGMPTPWREVEDDEELHTPENIEKVAEFRFNTTVKHAVSELSIFFEWFRPETLRDLDLNSYICRVFEVKDPEGESLVLKKQVVFPAYLAEIKEEIELLDLYNRYLTEQGENANE